MPKAANDLAAKLASTRDALDKAEAQDAPLSTVLAGVAFSIDRSHMPRERIAAMLALALVQLVAAELVSDAVETDEAVDSTMANGQPALGPPPGAGT